MSTELESEKRMPPSLKGTIYQIFLEAISEEIKLFRDRAEQQKTTFYDTAAMEKERLIQISENFGVPFSTIVRDDLEFLRQEVNNIGFKLFYKGTPTLYKSFFLSVDRIGQMFIYTYSSAADLLERSMKDPCDSAKVTPANLPFLFKSKNDFSGMVKDYVSLDSGLILDDSPAFKLDTSNSKISSNHIGLEYFIDRLIEKNSKSYLMTDEYLIFMSENINWGRRCKEVPHIGSQLSVQTDLSGLINYNFPEQEYSVPSLKLNVAANPQLLDIISSQYEISEARFGIGAKELPSVQHPEIPFPTELQTAIATVPVVSSEAFRSEHYIGACAEYLGQEIRQLKIKDDFSGSDTHFSFSLPLAPIRKGNVCLAIKQQGLAELTTVLDDRKGNFLSNRLKGTINYETGVCTLDTDFEYLTSFSIEKAYDPEDPGLWAYVVPKDETDITPGSLKVSFSQGEGTAKKSFVAIDDGEGHFKPNPAIVASEINYETGEIQIRFVQALTEDSSIENSYSYHVSWSPSEQDILYASYFFVLNSIEITEVGFFNTAGDLLMYATFPPLQFSSTEFHGNFTILVNTETVQNGNT